VEDIFDNYEARVTLQEVLRGAEAWSRIKEANQFNDPADPGFEYLLARIRFEYLKAEDPDKTYDLNSFQFTAVSSEGKEYEYAFVVEPQPQLSASLYPGASHEGWAAFRVTLYDTAPLLTFGRDYSGRGGVWWKLYE